MSVISNRGPQGPAKGQTRDGWDDAFEMISGWIVVWGFSLAPAWLINHLLSAITSLPTEPRLAIAAAVLIGSFLSIGYLADRMPAPAARARQIIYRWRYPIVLTALAAMSYQWGAYEASRSDEALEGKAATIACEKFVECRKALLSYDAVQAR